MDATAVLADVFGNALGNSIADQIPPVLQPGFDEIGLTDDQYDEMNRVLEGAYLEGQGAINNLVQRDLRQQQFQISLQRDLERGLSNNPQSFANLPMPTAQFEEGALVDEAIRSAIAARSTALGTELTALRAPAPSYVYPQIPSVMMAPNKLQFGKAYGLLDGAFSINAPGRYPSGEGFEPEVEYSAYPGLGVYVGGFDGKTLTNSFGVFTEQRNAAGAYYLREATADEAIGIQQAWEVAAKEWQTNMMISGALFYIGGIADLAGLALTSVPMRQLGRRHR